MQKTLLGPNGQPISSAQFSNKKADPPKLGPSFGQWAGRDLEFLTLPGGGVVQFDLSKLTLADFRGMRDHYQVNASLAVLSFMQHQSDFHIECADKKIADFCDEQLHNWWTPLNRAMSQANWAGYSPNAIEWDNDYNSRSVVISKVKDLVPEESRVNWKEVEGWAPPDRTKPKFKVYDGIQQIGSPWPIPVDNCVHPDTKILCADNVWRRAGDLEIGQEIVAFDEDEQLYGRRYKTATIEVNNAMEKECITVTTDIGDPITMSVDHPCLVRRGTLLTGDKRTSKYKDHWIWIQAGELQPGDRIGFFGNPWEPVENWESGYIAGILDGEGSLTNNGQSWNLTFSQRNGWVLERALDILDSYEFKYTVNTNTRDDCQHIVIRGGIREQMRFLGMFSPERIGRNVKLYENAVARIGRSVDVAVVDSVTSVGMSPIASIQTSTGTFITGGYLTHNSFWYPILMENGDYYGKKLLRPAFQSWFFSILIHLFSNRYYERFGEPVPIGRAPYDEPVEVNGTDIPGNVYMLQLLQSLRSRAAVVLPNQKSQLKEGTYDYDYDIEYLESQMRGADFERYNTRLDEEISLAMFTPILLMRTADVGSYNLGVGHMQMYLWMLNAMNGDRKAYIDPYILSPMVDYNFSENAPRAKIVFRKLGNVTGDVIQSVMLALINKDIAIPDLEQLGELSGMTLKQVQETIAPPPKPGADPDGDGDTESNRTATEAVATAKEIAARVRGQVESAFRDGRFDANLQLNMGYKRKFERALDADKCRDAISKTNRIYARMDNWLQDVVALGPTEFSGPDSFMSLFDRVLHNEIKEISAS